MRHSVSHGLRIAVVGASGATGRHVVDRALASGHEVVSLARSPLTETRPRLTHALWPRISDTSALVSAFDGVDAVISVIGGAKRGPTSVCTDAIASVIGGMQKAGLSRLIAVSAHGARESRDNSLFSRAVWASVPDRMKDKESMEDLIVASGLRWTIVRPPALSNGRGTLAYDVGDALPIRLWHRISRVDLADFLVSEVERPAFVGRFPRVRS